MILARGSSLDTTPRSPRDIVCRRRSYEQIQVLPQPTAIRASFPERIQTPHTHCHASVPMTPLSLLPERNLVVTGENEHSPSSEYYYHGHLIEKIKSDQEGVPTLHEWLQTVADSEMLSHAEEERLQLMPQVLEPVGILAILDQAINTGKKDAELRKRIFPASLMKAQNRARKPMLEAVFWAAVVVSAYHSSAFAPLCYDEKSFVAAYSGLLGEELLAAAKQDRLLQYCNVVRVAMQVIPFRGNKTLLHRIAVYLERSGCKHITGGSKAKSTKARLLILEQEAKGQAL